MAAKAESNLKSADAKLFWNGRSQAVRLPKEFRFDGADGRGKKGNGRGVVRED
jgi:antitoxin VapB